MGSFKGKGRKEGVSRPSVSNVAFAINFVETEEGVALRQLR